MDRLTYYQIYNHPQHRTLPALQKSHQMPKTSKKILSQMPPIQNTQPLCRILLGLSLSPHQFQIIQTIQYTRIEQPRAEDPNNYRPQLEDIPELEDDEENWEEGQLVDTDFIDHHNTTEESD